MSVLVGLVLTLAACGGDAATTTSGVATLEEEVTTTSTTSAAAAEVEYEDAVLEYVQCLREEGLEITDPDFDSSGGLGLKRQFVDDPNDEIPEYVEAAFDACEDLRSVEAQRFEREDLSGWEDNLFKFAECMREEGMTDFPDPDLSVWEPGAGLGPGNGPFGTLLFDLSEDPSAATALSTCQAAYGGAGTGGTTGH